MESRPARGKLLLEFFPRQADRRVSLELGRPGSDHHLLLLGRLNRRRFDRALDVLDQLATFIEGHRSDLQPEGGIHHDAQATDSKWSFRPNALATFMIVAKLGLPSADSAL